MWSFPGHYLSPILAGGLLFAVIAAWAWHEVERDRAQGEHELRQSSAAVRSALIGSMLTEVRRGRARTERLEAIFANVVATSDLLAIRLQAGSRHLAKAGHADLLPAECQGTGERFAPDAYVSWEEIDLGNCPVAGRQGRMHQGGRAQEEYDIDLTTTPQVLAIARGTETLRLHERRARQRGAAIVGTGTVAALALALAWARVIHTQTLRRRLDAAEERARQMEELEMAAMGLAHETKHPLGIIRGLAQQLHDEPAAESPWRERAEQIMEEADVAVNRLGEFMQFARIPAPQLAPVELGEVAGRVVALLQPDADSAGVQLSIRVDAAATVLADASMLTQLLLNLLRNSLQACREGDRVEVRVSQGDGRFAMAVADTGRGIPDELLADVCKPYVTGRPDGHGIGLAIVRRIADAHGWELAIRSREGQGTTATVTGLQPPVSAP